MLGPPSDDLQVFEGPEGGEVVRPSLYQQKACEERHIEQP